MLKLASVYAMNGKSVEVDNTDAEGRLVLAGGWHGSTAKSMAELVCLKMPFITLPQNINPIH